MTTPAPRRRCKVCGKPVARGKPWTCPACREVLALLARIHADHGAPVRTGGRLVRLPGRLDRLLKE